MQHQYPGTWYLYRYSQSNSLTSLYRRTGTITNTAVVTYLPVYRYRYRYQNTGRFSIYSRIGTVLATVLLTRTVTVTVLVPVPVPKVPVPKFRYRVFTFKNNHFELHVWPKKQTKSVACSCPASLFVWLKVIS